MAERRARWWFLLLALWALFGCRSEPASGGAGEASPTAVSDRAPLAPMPPPQHAIDPPSQDCAILPLRCNADYLSFGSRFADRARPVKDCDELQRSILALWDQPDTPRPELEEGAQVDLAQAIVDALNIGFLVESLDRPPPVSIEELAPGPGYRQHRLRFADAHVGTFGALLLLPEAGDGPFPAVLTVPGHNESPEVHRDQRHGALLAQRGYAVLIPAVRAYDSREAEHLATVRLLCQGFSLQGLRVYETLVALRHLAGHRQVDVRRIGLLGHSGGSATLNLVVRLGTQARALVTDTTTGYLNVHEGPGRQRYILDETHLGLSALSDLINDFGTSDLAVLRVPYGAPEGPEPILTFFEKRLSLP